jgi:hypothetical protein
MSAETESHSNFHQNRHSERAFGGCLGYGLGGLGSVGFWIRHGLFCGRLVVLWLVWVTASLGVPWVCVHPWHVLPDLVPCFGQELSFVTQ